MFSNSTSLSLEDQIQKLEPLISSLLKAQNPHEKLAVLNELPEVENFLKKGKISFPELFDQDPKYDLPIRSVIAIGQGPILFNGHSEKLNREKWHHLLETLLAIEAFYEAIGGIAGYHFNVLKLISKTKKNTCEVDPTINYSHPPGENVALDTPEIRKWVREGIQRLPEIAEMYPVGGAGDRLDLKTESNEPLPAALLLFAGKTLLEGLIGDLQAREYLYYKIFEKQINTPMAMMTSHEKNNHSHILKICKENNWFGRPQASFLFFIQPMAPAITKEGNWSLSAPLSLFMKPGGHGLIWKLAIDNGIFNTLQLANRSKAIVRQINNPIAGIDHGLLALAGLGFMRNKAFGFASCSRLLNTAEGMNVLLEKKHNNHYTYCIANIEYTEFTKKGIQDTPCEEGSPYSAFPANTNILFVDLEAIKKAVDLSPFPGQNINLKKEVPMISPEGTFSMIEGGRLETTMQNISDSITDTFERPLTEKEAFSLKTFITYNERLKTISVTKNSFIPGNPLVETPEGCFYDLLRNYRNLFENHCTFKMPSLNTEQDYLKNGPSFIILFHPALGPLFSVIAQKIQRGSLAERSELQLNIAELKIQDLSLKGSLQISATNLMGKINSQRLLQYGLEEGRCILENVKVINKGIDREAKNIYWKNSIQRQETCSIILQGNSEFFAKDLLFEGPHSIVVPDGCRMTASMKEGAIHFYTEKISTPSWYWKYFFDKEDRIILKKSYKNEHP